MTDATPGVAERIGRALGLLLLAAALLLAWPGVRAVRADQPDMTPVAEDEYAGRTASPAVPPAVAGEACEDAAPVRSARLPLPLPTDPRTEGAGKDADGGFVLLNNRGYGYGASDGPDPRQWLEIERRHRAGRD